jgi:hypothetical protein
VRYQITIYAIFLLFTVVYAYGFLVADLFADDPPWKRWIITGGSAMLWLLIAAVSVATVLESLTVDDFGLTRRSWRGLHHMPWPDVSQIEAQPLGQSVVIKSRGGLSVPVSLLLDGLDTLADALERHARFPRPLLNSLLGIGRPAASPPAR